MRKAHNTAGMRQMGGDECAHTPEAVVQSWAEVRAFYVRGCTCCHRMVKVAPDPYPDSPLYVKPRTPGER